MLLNELYAALAEAKKKPKKKTKSKAVKKVLPKKKVHIRHHVKKPENPKKKITKPD